MQFNGTTGRPSRSHFTRSDKQIVIDDKLAVQSYTGQHRPYFCFFSISVKRFFRAELRPANAFSTKRKEQVLQASRNRATKTPVQKLLPLPPGMTGRVASKARPPRARLSRLPVGTRASIARRGWRIDGTRRRIRWTCRGVGTCVRSLRCTGSRISRARWTISRGSGAVSWTGRRECRRCRRKGRRSGRERRRSRRECRACRRERWTCWRERWRGRGEGRTCWRERRTRWRIRSVR